MLASHAARCLLPYFGDAWKYTECAAQQHLSAILSGAIAWFYNISCSGGKDHAESVQLIIR
jgi:hypothetical protein